MYEVVFDLSTQTPPSWILGIAFASSAVGLICVLMRYLRVGVSSLIAGALLALVFGWQVYQLAHLQGLLSQGGVAVAQGAVRAFQPMPKSGHGSEQWCVENACFVYSQYETVPWFHRTESEGGPIHNGLFVRVHHVGNAIVRLEVRRDGKG